jgi:hypothetical protein
MVGDFNTPSFEWKCGLSLPKSHYYFQHKEDVMYISTCLLNLRECMITVGSNELLNLIFPNLSDLCITPVDNGLVKTDNFHALLDYQYLSVLFHLYSNYVYSYRKFSFGVYDLLYNILSIYDCSCVHDTTSVDSAVLSLNTAVHDAMAQAVPRGIINSKSKSPHWNSSSLR